jgi:hypothetical protein
LRGSGGSESGNDDKCEQNAAHRFPSACEAKEKCTTAGEQSTVSC